ncbi:MAG: class I SAM-dependent methyltransferase [Lachnospiraceae bacterium]|nr:class I SAM-dependent methyltransferase [Lachnospiraceae bacterium]
MNFESCEISNEYQLWQSGKEIKKYVGYCNICGADIDTWNYCGKDAKTKYAIIGNGKRVGLCPYCQSFDRGRWFYFVLKNFTSIFENGGEILHFAPEKQVEKHLRKLEHCSYNTADIIESIADYVIDMTNMPFENEKFDYIIANHVLEHIEDETAAISELKRCIKKNRKIILSFPVTMEVNTFELHNLTQDERIYYYGQDDHVRLYGRDFKEHLQNYGLRVDVYSPEELLSKKLTEKLKIISNDKLFICSCC